MLKEGLLQTEEQNKKIHYGWAIVACGFFLQFIQTLAQRGLSLNITLIQDSLGVSTAEIGMLMSFYGVFYGGCSVIWGWFCDRVGVRNTIFYAGLICGAGLIVFGLFGDISLFFAVALYSLIGFGAAGLYSGTVPKLIGAWFTPEKRGNAMRFVTPGGSVCSMMLGIVMPILAQSAGWQMAFVCAGVLALVIIIAYFLIARNDPAEKGLTPYGSAPGTPVKLVEKSVKDKTPEEKARQKALTRKIFSMKSFWVLSVFYILFQFSFMANSTFTVAAIIRSGYTPAQAGLCTTVFSLFGILGALTWGWISDKFERKLSLSCLILGWACFALIWAYGLAQGPSLTECFVACAFNGFLGANMPILLALFADSFPPECRGTGTGLVSSFALIGRLFGPIAAGALVDFYGNYSAAYVFAAACFAAAAIWLLIMMPKRAEIQATFDA